MAWNNTIDDIHTFTIEVTIKTIYHQRFEEGGKNIVYNVEFDVTGTDTDGSGNSYTLENEMLAFTPSTVNTSDASFVEIDDITDEIVEQWVLDFFDGNDNLDAAFTNLLYGPPDPVEPTDPV